MAGLFWALFALGWTIVLLSTFMIGHADLFGLKQVWTSFLGRVRGPDRFGTPALYRFVRHPMYLGLLMMLVAWPLVFGSLWAYVPALIAMAAFILVQEIPDSLWQTLPAIGKIGIAVSPANCRL